MQLDDLEHKYSKGMNAFKRVTQLTRKLFTIDPLVRPKAAQVVAGVSDIFEKARDELEKDPNCYLRDGNRRSGSLSCPNAPTVEAIPAERARASPSPNAIGESSSARQLKPSPHDSDGSPKPFLRRGKENVPLEAPPVSEYRLNFSDPGTTISGEAIAPEAGEDTIELEGGDPMPRNDTNNSEPWGPTSYP